MHDKLIARIPNTLRAIWVARLFRQNTDAKSHVLMKAKQQQSRWLNGFQVVIAQVTGTYGDNGIQHPLAGRFVTTQSAAHQ